MPPLRLGVSLQPRWPLDDGTGPLRAAGHAETLGFDHVAVGNRLLLEAAKALWTQRPADFAGPFTTLRAARLGVPPVTPGGPPVWVGGRSDAALRRALRFGDGWYGTGADAAELTDVRRRLREVAAGTGIAGTGAADTGAADTGAADRLTIASAEFLTPPGIPAAVPSPGRPLGGAAPTAASVADDLGRLAEAGLAVCTLWLPIAAEHVEKAVEWIAAEVMPQLTH